MQLSQESYRTRWLVLVAAWGLAAFSIFYQAASVRQYLDIAGQLALRGAPAPTTPLKQIYPAFAADAQTWVRHALSLIEGNSLRLRETKIDNAPDGREVHWNSAWAWTIAGAGWVYHLFSGAPLLTSVEKATIWLNPVVFLALIAIVSAWATNRVGLIAGVIVVAAMVGNDRVFEGFFPSYVDHHGLMTVAVLGLVLGAIAMGGGWWQPGERGVALLPTSPEAARKAARFSAIAGALGLWVTAASMIAPIVLVAIAALAALLLHGRTTQKAGASFDPETWRTWGRVGAAASLFFYFLEYFPNHLAFRLEANHPVHALAWFGGGELIAQFGQWWLQRATYRPEWPRLIAAGIAVSIAPLILLIGGTDVFVIMHPFMSRLHHDYIQEFLPIWRTLQNFNAKMAFQLLVVDSAPLIAGIATISYLRRESPLILLLATAAALLFNMLAWWQSRWLLNASGVQICLAIVVLGTWCRTWTPAARWILVGIAVGLLYVPTAVMRNINSRADANARQVASGDAGHVLSRDLAARIRASQPEGEITLLTSPNSSTGIGYYGRFKTLGTLYWENLEGLQSAAAVFAAPSERQAATLIRAHRITHIAVISQENFVQQYFQLLNPNGTVEELKNSFGVRLFFNKVVPQWLQMIPYKVPDELAALNLTVMLFKVNFNQSFADAAYNIALAQIESGALAEAEKTFDLLLERVPTAHQPWLRKGELQLARRDWASAADHFLKGISLAPAGERPMLFTHYAKPFYDARHYALAIRFYRAALADQKTADAACYLAWVLATNPDPAVRNGDEALELAQQATKADPTSPTYLSALAAALAEKGRFNEAMEAGERALANSRLRSEAPQIQQTFAERLAIIRSGKPLRVEP